MNPCTGRHATRGSNQKVDTAKVSKTQTPANTGGRNQMNNQERTKFMSEWIHQQERVRIQQENDKFEARRKERKIANEKMRQGRLREQKRKLGML